MLAGRFFADVRAEGPAVRPGGPRDKVLAHLADHPDVEFTPHEIHKVLGHSSEAIANALEHLLLAIAGQDDSEMAGLLRSAGADPASLRRAITTATAGSAQPRQAAPTLAARLDDVVRRLEEIEGRLAAGGL